MATTLKSACKGDHCQHPDQDSVWGGHDYPTLNGHSLKDLLADPSLIVNIEGSTISEEEARFIWFYLVVHKVCEQKPVARALGRTHIALRLNIMKLRQAIEALKKDEVQTSDVRWAPFLPASNALASVPRPNAPKSKDVGGFTPINVPQQRQETEEQLPETEKKLKETQEELQKAKEQQQQQPDEEQDPLAKERQQVRDRLVQAAKEHEAGYTKRCDQQALREQSRILQPGEVVQTKEEYEEDRELRGNAPTSMEPRGSKPLPSI